MNMPCANTCFLNQHLAQVEAEDEATAFVDDYVAAQLADRILTNTDIGMVLEALGEESERLMDALKPALISLRHTDPEAELTAHQDLLLSQYAWASLMIIKEYIGAFSRGELRDEARELKAATSQAQQWAGRA